MKRSFPISLRPICQRLILKETFSSQFFGRVNLKYYFYQKELSSRSRLRDQEKKKTRTDKTPSDNFTTGWPNLWKKLLSNHIFGSYRIKKPKGIWQIFVFAFLFAKESNWILYQFSFPTIWKKRNPRSTEKALNTNLKMLLSIKELSRSWRVSSRSNGSEKLSTQKPWRNSFLT